MGGFIIAKFIRGNTGSHLDDSGRINAKAIVYS